MVSTSVKLSVPAGGVPLVVPLLLCCVAAVFLVLVWVLYVRKRGKDKACTACTTGTVIGPSAINYSGHHIPLVRYEVAGREYRVAGPKFEGGTTTPGATCNIDDKEHPPVRLVAPPVLVTNASLSNEALYARSPLSQLYPVGSELTVWYDPADPKTAYVLRPVREGIVVAWVLLPLALCALVAAVVTVFL